MKTILVVEDVEYNRDLLVQILEESYRVITASDGAEGIEKAAAEGPDVILMDLSLPVVDGWEATRRLKADASVSHIPVIAITAHAMQGDEEKALACGCDAYLAKPVDENALLSLLRRHVGDGA